MVWSEDCAEREREERCGLRIVQKEREERCGLRIVQKERERKGVVLRIVQRERGMVWSEDCYQCKLNYSLAWDS